MKKPVHVLVPMATVGTTVKVSTITYVALILVGSDTIVFLIRISFQCLQRLQRVHILYSVVDGGDVPHQFTTLLCKSLKFLSSMKYITYH